jgi:DNA-binding FadR family transcriptional regulator
MAEAGRPRAKLAVDIAGVIARDIARRQWPVGHRLGSEPALMSQYGVSRAVLREAVRILEREGVAVTRRGPRGGLFVSAPPQDAAVRAMNHFLDYVGVLRPELHETRRAMELCCAELAAARIDARGAQQLEAHMELEAAFLRGGAGPPQQEFHRIVAELSHNRALVLFVHCAVELSRSFAPRGAPLPAPPALTLASHEAHRRIAAAIVAGEPVAARREMAWHLDGVLSTTGDSEAPGRPGATLW